MKFKNIRLPEDVDKIKHVLHRFEYFKGFGSGIDKDINSYRMFQDLQDIIDKLDKTGVVSTAEAEKEILRQGARKYSENDNWVVFEVTTAKAACQLSRNTKWCTSDARVARLYLEEGPLYVIFKKDAGKLIKWAQYTDDYGQFMDVTDRPISNVPIDLQAMIDPTL